MATKKIEMGDDYKEALKQREKELARRKAEEKEKADREKREEALANRRLARARKANSGKVSKAKMEYYRARLDAAQRTLDNGTAGIIGIAALGISGILFIATLLLFASERDFVPVLVVAFVLLVISLFAQSKVLEAEADIKKYSALLRQANRR